MVLTWNGFLPTSGHARLESNPTLSFLLSQCSWQNQGDVLLILTSQYSQLCGQHIILLLFPLNNSHHNGQCLCCLPAAHTTNRQPPFTRRCSCRTLPAAGCEHLCSLLSMPHPPPTASLSCCLFHLWLHSPAGTAGRQCHLMALGTALASAVTIALEPSHTQVLWLVLHWEKNTLFFPFWLTFLDEYRSEVDCVPKSNRVLEKEPFRLYSQSSVPLNYRHEQGCRTHLE